MTLTFAPFLPWIVIAVLAVAALLLSFIGLWRGVRGAWLRGLALAALLAAIANPLLTQEEREPLSTIVPVIVDRSQSQDVQDRPQMTDTALNALKDRLSRFPASSRASLKCATMARAIRPRPSFFRPCPPPFPMCRLPAWVARSS